MEIIIAIGIIAIILCFRPKKNTSHSEDSTILPEPELKLNQELPEEKDALNLQGAYQKKWMFSYNEKDAYWKLKKIAEDHGYIVFAKVRLLDILEPTKGNPKYKTFLYKVQAKHLDFVLCDQKLVAKIIIELDDSSHKRTDRIERDQFIDEILQNTGYKIIHTYAITENILDNM